MKSQYPLTNSSNWSPYISLKNKFREFDNRSKHLLYSDHFINSHNHFSWQHADIGSRKLMLVTVGTYRVKSVSVRGASTVCKNLMVRIIGLRCRCFSLASAQMAGPCRSPLPPPPPPLPHLLRPPTKSPAPGGYSREFWIGVCLEGSDPI